MESDKNTLLSALADSIKQCELKFKDRRELATDLDSRVSSLCAKFEALFLHGLKKPFISNIKEISQSLLSFTRQKSIAKNSGNLLTQLFDIEIDPQLSFWPYIKVILNKYEIERYEMLRFIKTDAGRCRAWLRSCLNENCMEKHILMIISKHELTKQYYEDWSILLDKDCLSHLLILISGLKSIVFAINIDNIDFNKSFKFINTNQDLNLKSNIRQSSISPPKVNINNNEIPTEAIISVSPTSTNIKTSKRLHTTKFILLEDSQETDEKREDSLSMTDESAEIFFTEISSDHKDANIETQNENITESKNGPTNNTIISDKISNNTNIDSKTQPQKIDEKHTNTELNIKELREALLLIMQRKNELEDKNQLLTDSLNQERYKASSLQEKISELQTLVKNINEENDDKNRNFEHENQLLKDQLKRYMNAIKLLRNNNSIPEIKNFINLEEYLSLENSTSGSISDSLKKDCINEAQYYEQKLIEVTEMHGELMEFNNHLQKLLHIKNIQIDRLSEELVRIRGPFLRGNELFVPEMSFSSRSSLSSEQLINVNSPLINIWIPSVFLRDSQSKAKSYHVYQIFIRVKDDEWNVYRRYAQFYNFHQKIKKEYPILAKTPLPPKKAIGNKDIKFVEQRRKDLQVYLRKIAYYIMEIDVDFKARPCKQTITKALNFLSNDIYERRNHQTLTRSDNEADDDVQNANISSRPYSNTQAQVAYDGL